MEKYNYIYFLIILFIFVTILCCGFLMSCNQTRIEDMVDISIVKLPEKLEYQFGEELNIDGKLVFSYDFENLIYF